MRLVKVATLALVALNLFGCATESTTESDENPSVETPSAEEPKQTFNAPLPSSDTSDTNDTTGTPPKTGSGTVTPSLAPKSEEPAADDDADEPAAETPAPAPTVTSQLLTLQVKATSKKFLKFSKT